MTARKVAYHITVICCVVQVAMCGYQNTKFVSSCLKGSCGNYTYKKDELDNSGTALNNTCPVLEAAGADQNKEWTQLHEAANQGRMDVAKCLVEAGAVVNSFKSSGTPLHIAARSGHLDMVKFLVENGAMVDARDSKGYQPLLLAASNGHTSTVKYLLDNNATIDNGFTWTALHEAANYGYLEIAEMLVNKGANVNEMSDEGTPVHLAAKNGRLEMLKYLVEQGGEVDVVDRRRYQPLQLAAQQGHVDCVKYLLDKGALIEHGTGWTALHEAANYGFLDIAKLLVEAGANVNSMTVDGTPVHLAATQGHLPVLKYLVESRACINTRDRHKNSPLHLAVVRNHTDVIEYLLGEGADVDAKNEYCWTPLHETAKFGYLEIAMLLLKKGADVNATTNETIPNFGARCGRQGVKNCWVENECEDYSPLHIAIIHHQNKVVKYLLDKGADVHSKNRRNSTPLHEAVKSGDLEVVSLLVERGADVNVKSEDGTPLSLANILRKTSVVEYLQQKGAL